MTLLVNVFMIMYAFQPQSQLLAVYVNSTMATIGALFLVLIEANLLVYLGILMLLTSKIKSSLFAETLRIQGITEVSTGMWPQEQAALQENMQREQRQQQSQRIDQNGQQNSWVSWMSSQIWHMLKSRALIRLREYLSLPLNFVPFVGGALYNLFNSHEVALFIHNYYFELKKLTTTEMAFFIEHHKLEYVFFSLTAGFLRSIPFIGWLFAVTNTIGAALWAANIEKHTHKQQ